MKRLPPRSPCCETVEFGGTTLAAHLTAGHTPGCTTWTMPVSEKGALHHVAFVCSITVAGNPLVGDSAYPQIVANYRASFAKLKALKADVLLTEHQRLADEIGKAVRAKSTASNPFVDDGELPRYVDGAERDFNDQLAKAEAAGARP